MAPADPAPSHPAHSPLGSPLTHAPATPHVFDFSFPSYPLIVVHLCTPLTHAQPRRTTHSLLARLTTTHSARLAHCSFHLLFTEAFISTLKRTQPTRRAGGSSRPRALAPCSKPTRSPLTLTSCSTRLDSRFPFYLLMVLHLSLISQRAFYVTSRSNTFCLAIYPA